MELTPHSVFLDFSITFIVAIGWAILFGIPKRLLWIIGLLGGMGHALRFLLIHQDLGIITSTLIASVSIGLVSIYISYWIKKPSVILTMPACSTMIPGLFAYRAMLGGIEISSMEYLQENPSILIETAHNLILTISLLFSLAIGISVGAILSRKVGRRKSSNNTSFPLTKKY